MSTGEVVPQWPADRLPAQGAELRKARRSLFGPIDHGESEKFVKDELEKQYRLDQEKWNFDFGDEQPLNGNAKRYEWTPVRKMARKEPDENRANGGFPHAGSVPAPNPKDSKQSQMTDFLRKRKHQSSGNDQKFGIREKSTLNTKSIRRSST